MYLIFIGRLIVFHRPSTRYSLISLVTGIEQVIYLLSCLEVGVAFAIS